ncbi:hypothetical protein E5E27_04270 [Helicobacter pylori]|nr:hypothetical protein E5E27_04270 [Helicobacter pylori]WRG50615.1 hypothetical protein E5E37_06005 [Helicobacter pylori]
MFELGFFLFLGLYIINSIYLYKALNSTKQSQEDFMNKHSELLESLLDILKFLVFLKWRINLSLWILRGNCYHILQRVIENQNLRSNNNEQYRNKA